MTYEEYFKEILTESGFYNIEFEKGVCNACRGKVKYFNLTFSKSKLTFNGDNDYNFVEIPIKYSDLISGHGCKK